MGSSDSSLSTAVIRRIETFLDGMMVEYDVPGLSIAVFSADDVFYSNGFGARTIESHSPATEHTLYSIASITKTVTAIAVLQLVEDGTVDLNDDIQQYVEFWDDVPGDPITVHNLLSHSSGMPSDFVGERRPLFAESPPTSPIVTRADYIRHANGMTDQRVQDPEGYMYNPTGYEILGDLLEAATDRKYAEYVEQEIFEPLGMERSQVGHGELSEIDGDCITGYSIEDGEPVPAAFDPETDSHPPHSSGGILSSVVEVATIEQCLMNDGNMDSERVLSSDLVADMCSHQSPPWETIDGDLMGYGYGVAVEDFADGRFLHHNGIIPGVCRAVAGFIEERDIGVVLGANSATAPLIVFGKGVLALAMGEEPTEVVSYLSLEEKIGSVTGTYEGYRGGATAQVDSAESQSAIEIKDETSPNAIIAFPLSTDSDEYRFYTVQPTGKREPVTFRETDEGMVMLRNTERLTRVSD